MGDLRNMKPKKATTEDVLAYFAEYPGEWVPIAELCEQMELSAPTVRKRLRILKQNGEPLIHGTGGYLYLPNGIGSEIEMAAAQSNAEWVRGLAMSLQDQAEAHKMLLKLSKDNKWFIENKELRVAYLQVAKQVVSVMVALELTDER